MTVTNCANCPLARQIEGERYECTSAHKDMVVRGHWEPTQDCRDAIAEHEIELQAAIDEADYQYKLGYQVGIWDAEKATTTYSSWDSQEFLEGYWVAYQDVLHQKIEAQKKYEQESKEREVARQKLGAGWTIIDGFFCKSYGAYSLPPAELGLTDREIQLLKGV